MTPLVAYGIGALAFFGICWFVWDIWVEACEFPIQESQE